MKTKVSNILNGVVGVGMALGLWSCAAETPFEGEGYGKVYLRTVVNNITTRAGEDVQQGQDVTDQNLKDNYVVYITNPQGVLIYNKKGLDNILSEDYITLKAGEGYVAEAWTGTWDYASFTNKYFEADKCTFGVSYNQVTQVVLNARIRNVVVSVSTDKIEDKAALKAYTVDVKHSKDKLTFNDDNTGTKGYFMMPEDETDLDYSFTFTRKDGTQFSKASKISNVEQGHHYILDLKYSASSENEIGSANFDSFDIEIVDDGITESSNYDLLSQPAISGIDFDINKEQVYPTGSQVATDLYVMICANAKDGSNGLASVSVSSVSITTPPSFGMSADSSADGIEWLAPQTKDGVSTAFIRFTAAFINSLSAGTHVINIDVADIAGNPNSAVLTISRPSAPSPDSPESE